MPDNRLHSSPVTDAAKRKVAENAPALDVVKLSNMTYGRLKTLQKDFPETSYERGDIDYAFSVLDKAREAVKKAEKEREEAVKAEKEAMAELDVALRKLNIESQEVSNIQDGVTAALATIGVTAGLVFSAPVALVIGAAATAIDFGNSMTRANASEDLPKTTADAFGGAVDATAEGLELEAKAAAKAAGTTLAQYGYKAPSPVLLKGLKGVAVLSAAVEIATSEGIEARLQEISHDGFNRLDNEISNAGTFVDKGPAQKAADKARFAMDDRIRAELVLKMKLAEYLKALANAEGVSWIRPR